MAKKQKLTTAPVDDGLKILDASKRMTNPMSVEYAVTPPLRRPA
jgi:hypothetical protein